MVKLDKSYLLDLFESDSEKIHFFLERSIPLFDNDITLLMNLCKCQNAIDLELEMHRVKASIQIFANQQLIDSFVVLENELKQKRIANDYCHRLQDCLMELRALLVEIEQWSRG